MTPKPALERLRKRAEFLFVRQGARAGRGCVLIEARRKAEDGPIRAGFTASKKVGNAVARNRAKRRLRAAARALIPAHGRPGWDYVLVARPGATVVRDFADLLRDLETALRAVHARP